MADVRALLSAEKQSRRIVHPHLTYTRTGALLCNVCDLNVKTEQLWPGHLKSANHRKNVQKRQEPLVKPVKRKAEELEHDVEDGSAEEADPKKRSKHVNVEESNEPAVSDSKDIPYHPAEPAVPTPENGTAQASSKAGQSQAPTVDEDEWAAFERDVAPLAQADYSAATITAAPVSAAELQPKDGTGARRTREQELEEEKEDEERRAEEELDTMEQMEERVRRLRERREALRTRKHEPPDPKGQASALQEETKEDLDAVLETPSAEKAYDDVSSDDDSIGEWYR